MKKITFLLSDITIPGGIQRVLTELVNELVKTKKYEITLLSIFKKNELPFFELNNDVRLRNLFTEKFDLRRNYFKVKKAISLYLDNQSTDIFINCGMGYVPLSFRATKKIKTISWEHSIVSQGKKYGMTWWGRQIAVRTSDCIVVITKEDLKNYLNSFKSINRIEQIYNFTDNYDSVHSYDINSRKIMSCGSLVYLKGYDFLVEVADLVFKKHPDWIWNIYGDGNLKESIKLSIKEKGLEKNLIINGYVENIEEYYNEHAIFVLTSRSEGFGMVLVEAQKQKLPIVSFNCPSGPAEIISHGENGILIDCYDIDKMADAICYLIENDKIRSEFSESAYYNSNKFNSTEILEQWSKLLQSF